MKLLLIGGPADGEIINMPEPADAGGTVKWAHDNSHVVSTYTLLRWGFTGVGWFYLGVHESVKEHEQSKLAVHAMLRPELLEILRPIR
jgi:hypothetical protein